MIGKVKKKDVWIPHDNTDAQRNRRLEICTLLMQRHQNCPFLNRIITCDEKWVLYDNRKRSSQWLDKNESPKQFPKPPLHPKKVMLSVWWSTAGVIHYRFFNNGETVDSNVYCQELEEVHQKLALQHPALINRKGPIILHDNARPHISVFTKKN